MTEERFPAALGQLGEDFGLQSDGDLPGSFVTFAPQRFQADEIGAPIAFIGLAFDEPGFFHAFQEGSYGIRIAGHEAGQFALGDIVMLEQGAHDGELIGRDAEVSDAATEGLVESVPGAAQKQRESAPFRRINGERSGCESRHKSESC